MERYDFVFIGGGHNSLTAAAYLAKAGESVIVLEQRDIIGGACMTVDGSTLPGLLPGFKISTHSQSHIWLHLGPVPKDLELEKYGARWIFPDPAYATVFSDGSSIVQYKDVDRTAKQIEKFSKRDAKRYRELYKEYRGLLNMIINSWFSSPAPYSQIFAPLEGTETGKNLVKMMLQSCKDIANQLFESEQMKVFIMHAATQGANPQDVNGTGLMFLLLSLTMADLPWGVPVGGSNMIAQALKRFIDAHGGKVICSKLVTKIIVENKKAVGVELSDGERIGANKAVVSSAGTQQTVLELIGRESFSDSTVYKAEGYRWDINSAILPIVLLKESLDWKAAEKEPDLNKTAVLIACGCDTLEEMQISTNDIKENRLNRIPFGITYQPSKVDPSIAPGGRHIANFWFLTCYALDGDVKNWDLRRDEVTDYCIEAWSKYVKNLNKDNILGKYSYTPYDWKNPHLRMGSMMGGDVTMDQMGIYRPFPGASNYKLEEIEGLYLTGATTHPCGGVTCAPGYNSVNVIADDFKVKKWWR